MTNGNDGRNGNGIRDTHVVKYVPLDRPIDVIKDVPLLSDGKTTVKNARKGIGRILDGQDSRRLLVVGPCSIHDIESAKEYADMLNSLRESVEDGILIVMRTYFEKPRTTTGWKGMINDPCLDESYEINEGLRLARSLLVRNAELGIPNGTELLGTIIAQYLADGVSWGALGARSVEDQEHRELFSALSMPVGLKNGTNGSVDTAIDAIVAVNHPGHRFAGTNQYGEPCIVVGKGNRYAHVVLRGGNGSANYDKGSVEETQAKLGNRGLPENVMVDCSHGNSRKDYSKQPEVFEEVLKQIVDGNSGIIGWMLESNIYESSQKIPTDLKGFDRTKLEYGKSVTDSCIGWDTTERLVREAYRALQRRSH